MLKMSNLDEPPAKITEQIIPSLEVTIKREETNEEWLSEEIFTDDDAANSEQTDSKIGDDSYNTLKNSPKLTFVASETSSAQTSKTLTQYDNNIEETLNILHKKDSSLSGELYDLFKENVVGSDLQNAQNKEKNNQCTLQEEENDGNDTDDLLRMLGDDNEEKISKVKKHKKRKTTNSGNSTEDSADEEKGRHDKRLRVKIVNKKKLEAKRPQEDKKKEAKEPKLVKKSNVKKQSTETEDHSVKVSKTIKPKQNSASTKKPPTKTAPEFISEHLDETSGVAIKKNLNVPKRNVACKSTSKSLLNTIKNKSTKNKKDENIPISPKAKAPAVNTSVKVNDDEIDEIINEAEFLEDDVFDLDEEFAKESDSFTKKEEQPIMKPERMDEEVPSDNESRSNQDYLYNVDLQLDGPLTDTDDYEEWFTIDVRTETASEFLGFLGSQAQQVLNEEKQRVQTHLDELQRNIHNLDKRTRVQADSLDQARIKLAELDAMLQAT